MINEDKWIGTLTKSDIEPKNEVNQLDYKIWENTIPKKNVYSSFKKYSLMSIIFVFGLLLVSVVKNETRNLEKEIGHLQASINTIKYNLNQAKLDNEVITSPGNISKLAKEYLNTDFMSYKKSQINKLSTFDEGYKESKKKNAEKKNKLSEGIKSQVSKKIEKKKTEIKKLQEIYSNPKSIPEVVKTNIAKQIKQKKTELENIYNSPKEAFSIDRFQKWGAVQVVKAILGIPILPGR